MIGDTLALLARGLVEVVIAGTGHLLLRWGLRVKEPDYFLSLLIGIALWGAVAVAVYVHYRPFP